MEQRTLQQHITDWLIKHHASEQHTTILHKVLVVGKKSKPWVEAIQQYVQEVSFIVPERGEIKQTCRSLLEQHDAA